MPTAQDIYDMLITSPNYQKTDTLTREEVVEREAKRRARQHANNEKALSMAMQNSAMGKLAYFVKDVFLQKALPPIEQKILGNKKALEDHLANIKAALIYYRPISPSPDGRYYNEDSIQVEPEASQGWKAQELKSINEVEEGEKRNKVITAFDAAGDLETQARDISLVLRGLETGTPNNSEAGLKAFLLHTFSSTLDIDKDDINEIYQDLLANFSSEGEIPKESIQALTAWRTDPFVLDMQNSIQGARGEKKSRGTSPTKLTPSEIAAQERELNPAQSELTPLQEYGASVNIRRQLANAIITEFHGGSENTESGANKLDDAELAQVMEHVREGMRMKGTGQDSEARAKNLAEKRAAHVKTYSFGDSSSSTEKPGDSFNQKTFYDNMPEDMKATFHTHMRPKWDGVGPIDEADQKDFDHRMEHFIRGLDEEEEGEAQNLFWADYIPLSSEEEGGSGEEAADPDLVHVNEEGNETVQEGQGDGSGPSTEDVNDAITTIVELSDERKGIFKANFELLKPGVDFMKFMQENTPGEVYNAIQDALEMEGMTVEEKAERIRGVNAAPLERVVQNRRQQADVRAGGSGSPEEVDSGEVPGSLADLNHKNLSRVMTGMEIHSPKNAPTQQGGARANPIYLSAASRKIAKDNKLITFDSGVDVEDDVDWTWTPVGAEQIKPILEAMHKNYPTSASSNQHRNQGTIRSNVFDQIIDMWKEKKLPKQPGDDNSEYIGFSDVDIEAEEKKYGAADGGPAVDESDPGSGDAGGPEAPPPPPRRNQAFDFGKYRKYIPRQIDGDNPPILLPKDENGEDYNPLLKGEAMTTQDLAESIDKLKRLYIDLHKGDEDTPHLGRWYFPTRDIDPRNPHQVHFVKDAIQNDEIPKFNKLNENKAILEEYLMLLTNMKTGEVEQGLHPQHGDAFWDNQVWDADDFDKYDAGNYIPRNGLYQWYQALESLGDKDNAGIYDKTGASTRDAEGNLNFHMLPGESREPDLGQDFTNFIGNFGFNYSQQVLKDIISNNELRFPGFTVKGRNNHFNKAWKTWEEENKAMDDPRDKNQFINWLEDKDDDDKPRFQHIMDGTTFGTPPPPPKIVDPEVVDPEVVDPEVVDSEGVDSEGVDSEGVDSEGVDPKIVPPPSSVAEEGVPLSHIDKDELVRRLMQQEDRYGFNSAEDRTWHEEDLQSKPHEALLQEYRNKVLGSRQKLREEAGKNKAKGEATKAGGLDKNTRQKMVEEYVSTYRDIHNQPLNPSLRSKLEEAPDKDLSQQHTKILEELSKHHQNQALELRTHNANNLGETISSLAPLQEHLTKDDILMQARRLLHHTLTHGKLMNSTTKALWNERWAEAHQLANAANMDLEQRLSMDHQEAEEAGDYGSTNWLKRVGDADLETQKRRGAHRDAVSKGSELRASVNYKPHIIARYDDYGNFQGFHDLKTVDENGNPQGIDQFNLHFDDATHYHFHGLDSEKVKEYQEYLALENQAGGETQGDIPPVFGDPPAPTNPRLTELKDKVLGTAEYKDVRDRLSTIGDLPSAHQLFYNKFGLDVNGRPGRPVNSDGSEGEVPRFYRGESDKVGTSGWYHPESESWINPHRYQELIDSMGGQRNSGRVILHGTQFYGKGARGETNPTDPKYAFATLTEAKKQKLRSGYDDQTYYVDDTGSIAHAHDSFEAGNTQKHDQPQTDNEVIHDWNAQKLGDHVKTNSQMYTDSQGNVNPVVVTDTPPSSAMANPQSLQNMWLELAAGESLGREKGSALARRDKKKQSGWEWFDRKLGGQTEAGASIKEGISQARHPFSRAARDPLSQQELGHQQWWSNTQELKQRYFDVIDWAKIPSISWLGRTLLTPLGGDKPEDQVIRRIRQGYQQQAMTERLTRDAASRITVNGQKLSDQYVAPGEQRARSEDYQELKRYFTNKTNFHVNQRDKNKGDVKQQKIHDAQRIKWVGFSNTLNQYDPKMPHHWEDINSMYDTHLGKVNQALPVDAASRGFSATMRQPEGREQRQSTQIKEDIPLVFGGEQGQSTQTEGDIPTVFGGEQQMTQTPSEKSGEIPKVFGV